MLMRMLLGRYKSLKLLRHFRVGRMLFLTPDYGDLERHPITDHMQNFIYACKI